jgi:hypothetical protein
MPSGSGRLDLFRRLRIIRIAFGWIATKDTTAKKPKARS